MYFFSFPRQEISDSVAQFNALNLLIPTVNTLVLLEDDMVTLQAKTALLSTRLIKKQDQCILVGLASHLFWKTVRLFCCCSFLLLLFISLFFFVS